MTNPLEDASQILLNSVKRAQLTYISGDLLGRYTRDRLRFGLSEDMFGFTHTYLARFVAEILEGKAYSEELPVAMLVPASPWQHLKETLYSILGRQVHTWRNRLVPGWLMWKFPVRYEERTTTVTLEGHWLYPQADIVTPHAGPVTIMEEATVPEGYYIPAAMDRFLSEGEILREFDRRDNPSPGYATEAAELLTWLKHHKVNVGQLVPRNSL